MRIPTFPASWKHGPRNMNLEYLIDMAGQMWRGPINPGGNLHWERFEGRNPDGSEIWRLCRERPPLSGSRIPATDARRLIAGTAK